MALRTCKDCGYQVSISAKICPNCGALQPTGTQREEMKVLLEKQKSAARRSGRHIDARTLTPQDENTLRLLSIAGSILLFIGIFMPIVSMPVIGSLNYFNNGKGDGTIVGMFAVLSVVLVLVGKYRALWLTGIASLGVVGYTFLELRSRLESAIAGVEAELKGNPFAGLATSVIQSVQMQWGWAILIIGGALVLATAFVYETKR